MSLLLEILLDKHEAQSRCYRVVGEAGLLSSRLVERLAVILTKHYHQQREFVAMEGHSWPEIFWSNLLSKNLFSQGSCFILEWGKKLSLDAVERLQLFLLDYGALETHSFLFQGVGELSLEDVDVCEVRLVWGRQEALTYTTNRLEQAGVKKATLHAQKAVDSLGWDFSAIDAFVERYCLLHRLGVSIKIEELLPTKSVPNYQLTKALGQKNMGLALQVLHDLLAQGSTPGSIQGYLGAYLSSLIRVQSLSGQGCKAEEIQRSLGGRQKLFMIEKSLKELSTWSESELLDMLRRLERLTAKTRQGFDPVMLLELLVIAVCSRRGQGSYG